MWRGFREIPFCILLLSVLIHRQNQVFSASIECPNFYVRGVEIPLPRTDRLAAMPLLIRSCGERFLFFQKRYSLPDFVRGERSECHLPLTTHRIKQAWQWWGWRGAALPPARPLLNLTFRQLAAERFCKAKSSEYTINLIVARRKHHLSRSPSGGWTPERGKHGELRDNAL